MELHYITRGKTKALKTDVHPNNLTTTLSIFLHYSLICSDKEKKFPGKKGYSFLRCITKNPGLQLLLHKPGFCFNGLKLKMEATPGFEPGMEDLQSSALPLGYVAL